MPFRMAWCRSWMLALEIKHGIVLICSIYTIYLIPKSKRHKCFNTESSKIPLMKIKQGFANKQNFFDVPSYKRPCKERVVVMRSAGVAPEVNLRNSLHADDKTCKPEIFSGFETGGRRHHKFKTGISSPTKHMLWAYNSSDIGHSQVFSFCTSLRFRLRQNILPVCTRTAYWPDLPF